MTNSNGPDAQIRQALHSAVADVVADSATMTRLIDNAKLGTETGESETRRRRVWIAPLLAAAAVAAIIVVTNSVIDSPSARHAPPAGSSTNPVPSTSSANPSPSPTPSTSSNARSSATPSPPVPGSPANALILGPDGLGTVKLGMTFAQALATGRFVPHAPIDTGCGTLYFKTDHTGSTGLSADMSAQLGLAAIFAGPGIRTPQGIELGSNLAAVQRAYPGIGRTQHNPSFFYPAPGNPNADYVIIVSSNTGKVSELGIALKTQDCFN